jgi:hypothetical protein
MTQKAVERRYSTQGRETGRYLPRRFYSTSRERFIRDRRRRYLDRLSGHPTDQQIATAQSLAVLDWSALAAENEHTLRGDREGREHRRLFTKMLDDFEKSLLPSRPRTLAGYRGRLTQRDEPDPRQ